MKPACVVLATAFLVACGGTPKCPVIDEPDPAGSELMIGPEDLLTINVWGQPTLTGPVRVRPDGKITMPLIGDVVVADRTTKEITTEITQRLTEFIRDVGSVTL